MENVDLKNQLEVSLNEANNIIKQNLGGRISFDLGEIYYDMVADAKELLHNLNPSNIIKINEIVARLRCYH